MLGHVPFSSIFRTSFGSESLVFHLGLEVFFFSPVKVLDYGFTFTYTKLPSSEVTLFFVLKSILCSEINKAGYARSRFRSLEGECGTTFLSLRSTNFVFMFKRSLS